MECWKCNYFYESAKKEPCLICKNKNMFKLWESKQLKKEEESEE